jgi:hypothetical protein
MDKRRFDWLGTWLATNDSRRMTLRALGAGILASGLSGLGLREATAKHKKKKGKKAVTQTCKTSSQCKGSLVCQLANSQNSSFPTTVKRCCKKLGERCDDGGECCGIDVICNGHFCDAA